MKADLVRFPIDVEQSLAESEARYRLLAENSRDVIACATVAGTLTYVSPSCKESFGYEPEEMIGRNWAEFMVAEDLERLLAESPGPDEQLLVTFRVRRKDGSFVWVESHARVVTDPVTNEVIEYQTAAREVTDRMESERALRAQTEVYEALLLAQSDLGEGCLIAENQKFVYANEAYCRISGYSVEDLRGIDSLLDLTTPEERAVIAERIRARAAGEHVPDQYETEMIRKDGVRIDLEVSQRVVHIDGRGQYVTIVRDITERKRAETALRESERRFADLYEREREATERLRQLDEMKNAFLAAVSHELRTPLTSILGLAHTLEQSGDDMGADERSDVSARIVKNSEKLHRLLADLLDIDRARLGLIEPRRTDVDVAELARTTAEEWMTNSGRMIRVDAEPSPSHVDGPKVERIVENLLSNASKHTPGTTNIWLRVRRSSGGVLIVVEDDGAGVRADMKRAIFEPFVQGDDSLKHAPGTGIGLALVMRFAQLHGGRAWVEDRPGGGARFNVYLPDVAAP